MCAYFFLRATRLCRDQGIFGLVATNTIGQGETREVALDQIAISNTIVRAVSSTPWPGTASLEVAHVWLFKGKWLGDIELDGNFVSEIGSDLTEVSNTRGKPFVLLSNLSLGFQGTIVLGLGFVMEPVEAQQLIEKSPTNKNVLFPYINGEDLLDQYDQSPSRWVINFGDMALSEAEVYTDCMRIVREKVKPERDILKDKGYREKWWQFGRRAVDLYRSIEGLDRVIAMCKVAKHCCMVFVPPSQVFSNRLTIFAMRYGYQLAVLQSTLHEVWARKFSATLETRLSYTPTDCFETYPFPNNYADLESVGNEYHDIRQSIMFRRREGLTQTYNRFHDPTETSTEFANLRDLHVKMDQSVADAYGWQDLKFGHGFHETKQGIRYTISEAASREVLDRLLALNHQRYAEEQAEKTTQAVAAPAKRSGKKAAANPTPGLFD